LLIRESKLCRVKIIRRKHDEVGNPVGSYNNNPILNTWIHLEKFPDGWA
jgi:hypothetical protein